MSKSINLEYFNSYMGHFKWSPLFQTYQNWALPAIILLLSASTQLFGDRAISLLEYQGTWLEHRQFWRIFTGHFTHLGWRHLLLNLTGLIMLWALYRKLLSLYIWGGIFIVCSVGISLGFALFDPNLKSYVGLSGVLHSLMAIAIIMSLQQEMRLNPNLFPWENAIIFLGLLAKIIYEQSIGSVPFTQSASGGDVVVNAHLYGTLIGVILGVLIISLKQNSHMCRP